MEQKQKEKPTWIRKGYSNSFKLIKSRFYNPENLFEKNPQNPVISPHRTKIQIVNKSLLRDRYQDMVDQVIQQYADQQHIKIQMTHIGKKNHYKNYRITEIEQPPIGQNIEKERSIFQKSIQNRSSGSEEKQRTGRLPPINGSLRQSLQKKYVSPRREELKVFKMKLFGKETPNKSSWGLFKKKYIGKYSRVATQI